MSNIAALVADNLDIWTSAIERKSSSGRGSSKKVKLYGITRLRALILDLAVRGSLVPQDAGDEPSSGILRRLEKLGTTNQSKRNTKEKERDEDSEKGSVQPDGWECPSLIVIAEVQQGFAFPSRFFSDDETAGPPLIKIGDLGSDNPQTFYSGEYEERYKVGASDILIGMSGSIKCETWNGPPSLLNQRIARIRPIGHEILLDWLYLGINSRIEKWKSETSKFTVQNLKSAQLYQELIPLPPLAEQKRIVAKVDELIALCDALERESEDALAAHQTLVETLLASLVNSTDAADLAKNWARLEKHFDILFTTESSIDTLKQTILDLAVRGKLVEQHSDDEPASELLTRIKAWQVAKVAEKQIRLPRKPLSLVKASDQPYVLASGWAWARLGEIINIRSGDGLTAAKMIDGDIPVYGGNGVNGYHNAQNIFEPTLVIGRVGFYCGSIHVTPEAAWITDNAFITRFSRSDIELEFLELLLNGTNLKENENATAQPVISGSKVYPIVVGLPPLPEQKRIVAKVDELMTLCEQLKARLADAAETQRHLADAIVKAAAA